MRQCFQLKSQNFISASFQLHPLCRICQNFNKTVQERKRMWYSQILKHCKNSADICSQWDHCLSPALTQCMNRTAVHLLALSSPGSVLALCCWRILYQLSHKGSPCKGKEVRKSLVYQERVYCLHVQVGKTSSTQVRRVVDRQGGPVCCARGRLGFPGPTQGEG